MLGNIKKIIRNLLNALGIDATQNLKYDRLTDKIIKDYLKQGMLAVDVGCHEGEILDKFIGQSTALHYAFEPIPSYFDKLQLKYRNKARIFNAALSDFSGETTFNVVKNAPAYSGMKQRQYAVSEPDIEQIKVKVSRLDDLIPETDKVDLIKIDVEGAELGVLKGASKTILRSKPIVIFECGLGASDFYGTQPEEVFDFIHSELNLRISKLESFIKKDSAYQRQEFINDYLQRREYYFVAHP
jgi:FkbM family methyltransferase